MFDPFSTLVTWMTGVRTSPWLMCTRLGVISMVRSVDPLAWIANWIGTMSCPLATTLSWADDPSV